MYSLMCLLLSIKSVNVIHTLLSPLLAAKLSVLG